ncbi:MAG TPA: enoyl-CoA hydratase/isomerase family protein [Candidatus Dormibacteraeota bacterium]
MSTARQGAIGVITLRRPRTLNALTVESTSLLAEGLASLAEDRSIAAIIIRADEGRAFCAGADLREAQEMSGEEAERRRRGIREMLRRVRSLPQPSIASVFGYALGGGCELALSCDLIVAAEDAVFGLPELAVGAIPGGGGTHLLPEAVGTRKAKELLFTARRVGAAEALTIGIASRVVARKNLDETSHALATEMCNVSPSAVAIVKRLMRRSLGRPDREVAELEATAWTEAAQTPDYREGLRAFLDKREPRWQRG